MTEPKAHILSSEEVRRIRTKLGLSQEAAGRILGGGVRAFTKYEADPRTEYAPSLAMCNLLRLLDQDPERLKELPAS